VTFVKSVVLSKVNGITGHYNCKSKFRENFQLKSRISKF